MIVAKHSSYLDGAVLCAVCPGPPAFVAKEELRDNLSPVRFCVGWGRFSCAAPILSPASPTPPRRWRGRGKARGSSGFPKGRFRECPAFSNFMSAPSRSPRRSACRYARRDPRDAVDSAGRFAAAATGADRGAYRRADPRGGRRFRRRCRPARRGPRANPRPLRRARSVARAGLSAASRTRLTARSARAFTPPCARFSRRNFEIAQVHLRHRHHHEHVRRVEGAVDHGAVAESGRRPADSP